MPVDKIDLIYDAMVNDGASMPDRAKFKSKMLASGEEGYKNRKDFYDAMVADGADLGGSYEAFAKKIGLHAKPKPIVEVGNMTPWTEEPTKEEAQAVDTYQQQIAADRKDGYHIPIRNIPDGFSVEGDFTKNPITVNGKQRTMGDVANELYRTYDKAYRTHQPYQYSGYGESLQKATGELHLDDDTAKQLAGGVHDLYMKNVASDIAEELYRRMDKSGDALYNAQKALYDKEFLNSFYDHVASLGYKDAGVFIDRAFKPAFAKMLETKFNGYKVNPDVLPTTLEGIRDKHKYFESQKTVEEGLNNKLGELEKYEKALNEDIIKRSDDITKQRIEEERNKSWWQLMLDAFARGEGMNTNSPEIEQKLSDLRGETSKRLAIHYAIKDARNTQEAANMFRRGDSSLSQIGKGALDRFTDVRAWDFGLTDMDNNMATLAAVKNYEKGKASSTDEKLLEAIAIGNSLRSRNQDAMSNHDVGSGAVDSAFYGLTFIATPYNGLGGKLAQQFEKFAVKRFGTEAIKSGVLGKMALAIGKKSARMTGDLVVRPMMTTAMYGGAHIAADTSSRQAGNIGFNDNGSVEINGKESNALTALAKATGALYIENMSEVVSDFIPGSRIIGKSLQKGIGKTFGKKAYKTLQNWGEAFTDAWTKVGTNEISTVLEQARKRAKLGDLTREYIEEIVGGIGNALVIGDQTLDTQEGTGVFNTDNMWQTLKAISVPVGTMNAVQYGAHKVFDVPNHFGEAARYEAKERMLKKQVRAQAILGDKWQSIKDIVDGTDGSDNSSFGAKMSEATRRLNPEAKKAVVDYVVARGYYNGANMQSLKENLEGLSGELAEAYKDGNSIVDEKEMYHAKALYDAAEKRLHDALGTKYSEALPDDATLKDLIEQSNDGDAIADRIQLYMYAKAQYYGMIERVQTNLDLIAERAEADAETKKHKQSGKIIPAVMKTDDRSVYVIDGEIACNDDGSIDTGKSSDSIMVRDAETGKVEMVSPSALLTAESPVDMRQVVDETIRQQTQSYAEQEADKMEGTLRFLPNDTYYIFDNDNEQHEVLIIDNAIDEQTKQPIDGMVMVSIDGAKPTTMSKQQLQDMYNSGTKASMEEKLKDAEVPEEQKDIESEQPSVAPSEQEDSKASPSASDKEASAMSAIPTDESGQPVYEQADAETAWDAIMEQADGNADIAQAVADDMVSDMEAVLKKAEKTKAKGGATVAEKIAAEKERIEAIEKAKSDLEHWKRIAAVNFNRQAAVQVEQQRKDEEAAESANQRGVEGKQGAADEGRSTNVGGPSERQSDLGKTEEVKLSDEIDENGRQFVLTSEGELAFGEIGEGTGLTAAPILLSEGMITNAATNDGYGLVHIEARHGDQIRNAGYKSVVDFIETVAKNYDVIKEGNLRDGRRTYRLQLTDKHNNTLMVELSGDGTYWNINTAGIFKTSYGKKNKEVYNRHTTVKQPVEAAETSQDAEQGDTQTSSSMNVPTSSESKVINNQSDLQENGEKSSEKEGVTPLSEQIAAQEAAARKAEQEEAERQKREALNGVPNVTEDTASDARARGYRRVDGDKVDRQEPINAKMGKEVNVKFDDDNMPIGHIAIIEAAELQPSHTNGRRNPLHFIDEAQPKERIDDASKDAARKIASKIRPEEITTSITAYTGAPTVNSRGEVIQGNNRSAALKEMWSGYQEQADKYKQYLIEHADELGLSVDDIKAVKHPVLVNMLNVTDDEAIKLGQFVASDTESGGTERIKPKNVVKKLGEKMRNFANILLDTTDEDMTFAELIDKNGLKLLQWLNAKGIITPTQYKSAFDTKGNLTAEAKNDIKGTMYQSIFEGGSTQLEEMFATLPAKAQKAILATAYRDNDSSSENRMISDIQESIMAFYALSHDEAFMAANNHKDARMAVESWKRQYAFDDVTGESYLPSERFSNFALLLAVMYKGDNQRLIQSRFNNIYDLIQGTQQSTLFEEADNTPHTLSETIKETLNIEYDGKQRSNVLAGNTETSQRGERGSNGDDTAGGRSEESDGSENHQGGTHGDSREGVSGKPLSEEQANVVITSMEDNAVEDPQISLTPETWIKVFGINNSIETPIGNVKMGENQYAKLQDKKRTSEFGMISLTLSDPDVIFIEPSEAKEGKEAERNFSYVFAKTYKRNGKKLNIMHR